MGVRGPDRDLLRRLESALTDIAAGQDRLRLAFSGGMGSLVLAALMRKRTDLECFVAGLPDGRDLALAAEEQMYLDFDVREVRLSPTRALVLARDLARRFPVASDGQVLDLVPLEAVCLRCPDASILAGLGVRATPAALAKAAVGLGFRLPFLRPSRAGGPMRPRLVTVARSLALPEAFVRAPSRTPALGSGVGPALRILAAEKGRPLVRLLRP